MNSKSIVLEEVFYSKLLGRDLKYNVYLPTNYSNNISNSGMFLLHGLYGCEKDWTNIEQGNAKEILDNLFDIKKSVLPMVVIMPDAGNSWYVDSDEKIYSAFKDEFFPAMEKKYNLSSKREDRFIGGLSMGGAGALRFFYSNPHKYGSMLVMSPSLLTDFHKGFQDVSTKVKKFDYENQLVDSYSKNYFNSDLKTNVYVIVGSNDGCDDGYGNQPYVRKAFEVFEKFKLNGDNVQFRVVAGGHDWAVWRFGLEEGLETV